MIDANITSAAEDPYGQCAPAAPYAVLADGTEEPLTNCPGCGELGLARFAHYHVCPPVIPKDDDFPLSMREVLERNAANVRHYLEKHPEDAEAFRATPEYQSHVERLRTRASQLPEGHWSYRWREGYVELMSDAYVWERLVE